MDKELKEATRDKEETVFVVPLTFTITWKDAYKEPPIEGGRYWCVVRVVDDLGISHYQWNCAYNPETTTKWTSDAIRRDVVLWTELPQMPVLQ